ncbi:class I SAM-dependent methyltransferase [Pseudohalioglobus sediminis]|uniref:Class I SAM-dependent methyltransferase n=1 Tax=Pseudohalioglobus sediminis TaxID=2606449 RepID=A0A5B0X410_9GAMM|nr:cyclopropane-fatty-acyl-phospholipid synthase family protein [Pseudohalioglobus sediminis]KAA1194036.1 class I SAM-dependent methyltransferase [Pseudohalioglobus sediminis]
MNDASVNAISVPELRGHWRGEGFSRSMIKRLLARLTTGSLTVREGERVERFGDVDGDGIHAVVNVHDSRVFQHVLTGGVMGSGESYMLGHWSSPCLVDVIRLFSANMETMRSMDARSSRLRQWLLKGLHALNNNSLSGSRRNIGAHYDLGNEFFKLFLDPTMMYSSAVYPSADASLEEASLHKLELLCQQLELSADDHLLEIGTGWGGMAVYAAQHYGCRVTTTTISREQYRHARRRVQEMGLEDRVTVLCEDYRKLSGTYDKIVSIEMLEAVGHQYYGEYFRRCSSLLKPGGKFAVQVITVQDQRYEQARDSVDFIKRYIFPGGCLPSLEVLSRHVARDSDMQMVNLRDITADYARTLADWRERFLAARTAVREQGFDERFERMWEFYLCYCEGGFRERIISTVQLTFAKPGYRFAEAGQ